MIKILWVMNKYVDGSGLQIYYPYFLKYLQEELQQSNYELHFVFFSDLFRKNVITDHNHFYDAEESDDLSSSDISNEARRIEREYDFTFKQAWFPDILQISRFQNGRKISVPESELNSTDHLVGRFLFLERLVLNEKFDVLFSDVSPEAEMEFGRALGLKHQIPVIKTYEGSFLGRTVLLQHGRFGKDRLIEGVINPSFSVEDAKRFVEDFISNRKPAYERPRKLEDTRSWFEKAKDKIRENPAGHIFIRYPLQIVKRVLVNMCLWMEQHWLKPWIYDQFVPNIPYLFFGFHLNQESTMGLRSLPYVNQTVLVEMISRVLPYGYTLYVREHPHWPRTFPFRYLAKLKKYPNVRLLSPTISIHDVLKNAKGVLIYNSNTGNEALIYGKPILSFASNIYHKHHPAVIHCTNLFELGEKLAKLVNTNVAEQDTWDYLKKLNQVTVNLLLGSETFLSIEDAINKSRQFAHYLDKAIDWVNIHGIRDSVKLVIT